MKGFFSSHLSCILWKFCKWVWRISKTHNLINNTPYGSQSTPIYNASLCLGVSLFSSNCKSLQNAGMITTGVYFLDLLNLAGPDVVVLVSLKETNWTKPDQPNYLFRCKTRLVKFPETRSHILPNTLVVVKSISISPFQFYCPYLLLNSFTWNCQIHLLHGFAAKYISTFFLRKKYISTWALTNVYVLSH